MRSHGRLLGIATKIGSQPYEPYKVTVFDMDTFEVVNRIAADYCGEINNSPWTSWDMYKL